MAPPGQPRTSQEGARPVLRDVSRVRISTDVAAPLWPAVAAAAIMFSPGVAAHLVPAVAAAAKRSCASRRDILTDRSVDSVRHGGSELLIDEALWCLSLCSGTSARSGRPRILTGILIASTLHSSHLEIHPLAQLPESLDEQQR